jgi:hypothetical protein
MPVQNAEIADMFDQTAELLEIRGDNPFRSRAYRNAARMIERLPKSITSLLKVGEDLSELPGIGKDLAGKIATIVATHHFDVLDKLKRELPGDLAEIATLQGLGPKRVRLLYDKLHIRSLEDLRRAVKSGRLKELRGFGAKSEQKLAAALAKPQAEKRFKLSEAEAEAEALLGHLRPSASDGQVVVAGSYRRRRDTVGDLDVLMIARDGSAAGDGADCNRFIGSYQRGRARGGRRPALLHALLPTLSSARRLAVAIGDLIPITAATTQLRSVILQLPITGLIPTMGTVAAVFVRCGPGGSGGTCASGCRAGA